MMVITGLLAALQADGPPPGQLPEFTTLEWSLPTSPLGWLTLVLGTLLVVAWISWLYRRDTREHAWWWTGWLLMLRLLVVAALLLIFLNPRERTQYRTFRPSRVLLLVDSSLSMSFSEEAPGTGAGTERTRGEAVRDLLAGTPLIKQLTEQGHAVSVYTFDARLSDGPVVRFASRDPRGRSVAAGDSDDNAAQPAAEVDWDQYVRPWVVNEAAASPAGQQADDVRRGLETRLGDAVLELLRREPAEGLAGIVVLTDGASNAGSDPVNANTVAIDRGVRLFALGTGSTERPDNLQIVNLQAPSDVHLGDEFRISAFVQGQGPGVIGSEVTVELLRKPEEAEGEPDELVESRNVPIDKAGEPIEVTFELDPDEEGRFEFLVRATPAAGVSELSPEDNQRRRIVNVTDRKMRVLLVAGGPMRDYRFVRNMLFRHSGVEVDVWLQSTDPGDAISQDSDRLLVEFPETREELFEYDVLVTFDPNWGLVAAARREILKEWVFKQAGGLILVAGDVYTPELASAGAALDDIRALYPVLLEPTSLEVDLTRKADQAWPIEFTPEGRDAPFLQLTDEQQTTTETWEEFTGVYRCYPTAGHKPAAMVYANFTDPRTDHHILMASQFFGAGQILYIGSPEMWRLRSIDEDIYDRFWIKAIREIGQARLKRETDRGTLLLERRQFMLGQTIPIRVHLQDPQFQDLKDEEVDVTVRGPNEMLVALSKLRRQTKRPGQYAGSFQAGLPGTYHVRVPIPPENEEALTARIEVVLPDLESVDPRQNQRLLEHLVRDTGGEYKPIAEVARDPTVLVKASLLPNLGELLLKDKGPPNPWWDEEFLLYLLVGLLSAEWITRKLLKLA